MFTIMIVDDSYSDRMGLLDLVNWEQLGIKVVDFAVNGLQGYEKAMVHKPDFILTDVAMPLMDGLKMAEKVKCELPDTKIIFMSCFDEFEYAKKAINLKAYGYVLKPIDLEELTSVLLTMANIRHSELDRIKNDMELKERIAESMTLLREQFFKSLLYGKFSQDADIQEHVRFLNIEMRKSFYSVIYIKIDDYDILYPDIPVEQRFSIILNIRRGLEDNVLDVINGQIIDQEHGNITAILFPDGHDNEEAMDVILNTLSRYMDSINHTMDTSVTIGISNFSNSLLDVPKAYKEAEYAAKYKFYSGGNKIILASEVKSESMVMHFDPQKTKLDIEKIMDNGDRESIRVFINKYYNSGANYSEVYIKGFSYTIASILQSLLIERNESFNSIFEDPMLLWRKLGKAETITEIKQQLENVLEEVRQLLVSKEDARYKKIITELMRIIDQNYANIKNIDDIIRSVYISSNYANVIFKKHIGMTVFDYLVSVRMKKAKELLADPYVKMYEVAEKVGYKSKSYFSVIFKESTGMTPKQYSNSCRN